MTTGRVFPTREGCWGIRQLRNGEPMGTQMHFVLTVAALFAGMLLGSYFGIALIAPEEGGRGFLVVGFCIALATTSFAAYLDHGQDRDRP